MTYCWSSHNLRTLELTSEGPGPIKILDGGMNELFYKFNKNNPLFNL